MIAHFVVESERNVWRLGSVDVENTITEVLSWVLTALVRTSLFHEQGRPFVEIVCILDSGVFEDHMAVLSQLFLKPLIIMHVDRFLALLWFESVDVGYGEVVETWEDVFL